MKEDKGTYSYVFYAQNGMKYTVAFKSSFWLPQENAFEISIENDLLSSKSGFYDPNLAKIIINIINNFLSVPPNCAISYVCDTTGGQRRSKARAVLFERWFSQNNSKGEFIHLQGSYTKDTKTYYTGILFSIYNEDKKELKEAFFLINRELNK